MTSTRSLRSLSLAVVAVALGSCATDPIAPAGATVTLSVGELTIPANGGTTSVSAFVTESDGYAVPNGTLVTFLSSGGVLCAQSTELSQCKWEPIIAVKSVKGIAVVRVMAGASGQITIDAKSGPATKSTTITASSIVAPADGRIYFASQPDTLRIGETSALTVYLTTAAGAAVPNATRVHVSANSGSLARELLLTEGGFATTRFTAAKVGDVELTANSGPLSKLIKVVVTE